MGTEVDKLTQVERLLFDALRPHLAWVKPAPVEDTIEVTHAYGTGITVSWKIGVDPSRPNQRAQAIAVQVSRRVVEAVDAADAREVRRIAQNVTDTLQAQVMAYPGNPDAAFAHVIKLDDEVLDAR